MGHAFDEEFEDSRDAEPQGAPATHAPATHAPATRAPAQDTAHGDLVSVIERYIIPRMMLAHGAESSHGVNESAPPSDEEVATFAELAAREDLDAALIVAETACRRGLTFESLLLELIAPAARLLGAQWLCDQRSFTEVTSGTGTLHHVIRVFASRFSQPLLDRGQVLLTAPEREQHTLGLNILAEFLRRAGWVVDVRTALTTKELLEYVATESLEMVGFTVSDDRLLDPLGRVIGAIRRIARNPKMAVLVGGPLPLRDFAARCGAACPGDALSTVQWLERRE